jgi:predicted nuclease of predicted toxin-antitoxin system
VPLRLYADECVNARVVAGLRRRGVDIATAADNGLLSASDELHLARAITLGRAVVTSDRDFLVIVSAILIRGESFPGLIFIQPRSTPGDAVRRIAEIAKALDPADIQNAIEWIP